MLAAQPKLPERWAIAELNELCILNPKVEKVPFAPLVTSNIQEFQRVPGLSTENWIRLFHEPSGQPLFVNHPFN